MSQWNSIEQQQAILKYDIQGQVVPKKDEKSTANLLYQDQYYRDRGNPAGTGPNLIPATAPGLSVLPDRDQSSKNEPVLGFVPGGSS